MTVAGTDRGKRTDESVEHVRGLMEELNIEAAEYNIWVRTQANAPSQRPWFTDNGLEQGALSAGRVGVGQMKVLPCIWRWNDYEPFLRRLSETAASAETSPIKFVDRQSILLVNPGLKGRLQVSSVIRSAISIYNPGDVAPSHVHSPNATRTILTERGGYTNIQGEICNAERGDVIVTPNGTWHDHGNDDAQPVIWMDLLDWPLLEYLDCVWIDPVMQGGRIKNDAKIQTVEHAPEYSTRMFSRGGIVPTFTSNQRGFGVDPTPMFRYKGAEVREVLKDLREEDGDPHEGISVAFVNPVTGAPLFKTIHYSAQLLRPGEQTQFKRETCSTLYIVMEGSGVSEVGGQVFEWGSNDVFIAPNFLWRRHANTGSEDAVIYAVSEAALLRAVGQYRAQGMQSGAVSELSID